MSHLEFTILFSFICSCHSSSFCSLRRKETPCLMPQCYLEENYLISMLLGWATFSYAWVLSERKILSFATLLFLKEIPYLNPQAEEHLFIYMGFRPTVKFLISYVIFLSLGDALFLFIPVLTERLLVICMQLSLFNVSKLWSIIINPCNLRKCLV